MAQILVPFDHSENAFIALQQALLIAQKNKASIELFHVINLMISNDQPMEWSDDELKAIEESLQSRVDVARKTLNIEESIQTSIFIQKGIRVVDELLIRAENSDTVLIVMGTHGVTGLLDRVMGTNSLDVLKSSEWPLLLIPPHWTPQSIDNLIVATEIIDMDSISASVTDLKEFFEIPVRAVQLTSIPNEYETAPQIVEGIPFEFVQASLKNTLAENLRDYTSKLKHTVLIMFTHPRKLLQRIFDKSLTNSTAKVIEIPLLSIRKNA